MDADRDRRESGELVLAATVAGGVTVGAVSAPSLIRVGGHAGAEYVYLALQLIGPIVFAVAALIAFLVYRFGPARVPHPVLAAITAVVIGALAWLTPTLVIGLIGAYLTTTGAFVAAPSVFLALWLAVAVRRRRVARAAARSASAGGSRWEPRIPLAAIVALAALAAGIPPVVASLARNVELMAGPGAWPSGSDVMSYAVLGAIPSVLTTAWAVLVVLLADRWGSPRVVRAAASGLLTAILIGAPALMLAAGLEFGGEVAALGAVSGAAAGAVVLFSERKVVAPAQPRAAGAAAA